MAEHPPARTAQPPAQMAATVWQNVFTDRVTRAFPDAVFGFASYLGQEFITCAAAIVCDLIQYLLNEESFDFLVDLTVVDYPKDESRFELIYILYSFSHNKRIRIKVRAAEAESVPSITSVFRGANWLEREAFDMFGITFAGHPSLKRILMPDGWTGFPLRKDSSILAMDNGWVQANLGIESGQ